MTRLPLAARGRTGEQQELADAIRDVAADRCDSARRREVLAEDPHWSRELWRLLAVDVGLAGIGVDVDLGGTGGSFADTAVAIEAAAATLLPVPVLPHLLACAALGRQSHAELSRDLKMLASGERTGAVAVTASPILGGGSVTVERVLLGQAADLFLVGGADGMVAVRRADAEVTPRQSLDLSRPHATVTFAAEDAVRIGDADASSWLVDAVRVALGVEAIGVAQACLSMTREHLLTREQFGRPIGSFQALQHRMADLLVLLEAAVSTADHAVRVVTDDSPELAVVAPLAKSVCCDAAVRVAGETIQLHGGIGFTWEHDAHLYFKRATALSALLGSSAEHRRLVAERAGIVGGAQSG